MLNYVLCGWYETEFGLEVFEVEGLDLEACVTQVRHDSDDFGHTDMELNGGYGTPDYDVTSKVIEMVCEPTKKPTYTKEELMLIGRWNVICNTPRLELPIGETETIPININEFVWLKKEGFV
jgi:hypothetical protein